ncbi:nibrin [Aplochiton taeniatus]
MWILKPLQAEGVINYLLPSQNYVVGRKNCEILLQNDQSISRVHAQLTASEQGLTLKDSSKYGTFVNEQRLPSDTAHSLKPGDKVTFGVFHSKFSVSREEVVVCSSCLDSNGKAALSQALLSLGGRLVNAWTQDCTHLAMPSVKITIKTVCALLCCRPIVRPEFFTVLSKALQEKRPAPQVESFIQEVDEPCLRNVEVDMGSRPERKSLFTGKTFLFLGSKQLKRLSSAVSFGGGRSQLLEEGSLPVSLLESPLSCVVNMATGNSQALSASTQKWSESIGKILHKKSLRFIPESEIALAAMFITCDKYCNPSNLMTDSGGLIPTATLSQNAIVEETVLPAASCLNITAYAANTETSQGEGATVGETPEKNQSRGKSRISQPKPSARELATTCTVAETMMSSFSTTENTGVSLREIGDSEQKGIGLAYYSNQMPLLQFKDSPTKQASLTSFFQPISKKRPREDQSSPVESQSKRTVPLCSGLSESTTTTRAQIHTPKRTQPDARTATTSSTLPSARTQPGTAADLFSGESEAQSDGVPPPTHLGLHGRKRKAMEKGEPKGCAIAGVDMQELESIMSEEMDDLDEQFSVRQVRTAQEEQRKGSNKKQSLETTEQDSVSKKSRLNPLEYSRANQSSCLDSSTKFHHTSANERSSLYAEGKSTANTSQHSQAAAGQGEDVSFIEASKPPNGINGNPVEEPKTAPKSITAQTDTTGSERGEAPSSKLVVVFKSLTVAAPVRATPQQRDSNSYTNNFKRFRKVPVPGAQGLPNIIGGSDLLTHNRVKNSDLEEWLKDAAEEEHRHKVEESIGDDLFRYNPKTTRRR